MTSGNTRASAAGGRMIGRLGRCRVGKPVTLLTWGILCCVAIASGGPASAQVPDIPSQVTVANSITGNVTLSGTIDGGNGPGYFVANGGVLTVNNGSLQNFTTTGGAGSGGGLGAGGAIFIDTGGTAVLNGVSFSHDTAVGGLGGTSSPYGGTLNNIQAVTPPNGSNPTGPPPNGTNGANGYIYPDNQYIFGDGKGNGVPGIGVGNGGNATNGFGGNGGIGGPGTNGWSTNPVATTNNNIAIENVANASAIETQQAIIAGAWTVAAALAYASGADPFATPVAVALGITSTAQAVLAYTTLATDTLALASAVQSQQVTQGTLNAWNTLFQEGLAGNGGNGENGGNGGKGSYGFGGGAGGQGGAYGLSGNPNAPASDGTGGNGGIGGAGGFGGGGGAGGYGFGAGQNGCGDAGCTSSSGTGGAGGTPGFGGGVGSTGGVTGISGATGGGGGDGYGGAIFVNSGASLTIAGTSTFSGNEAIGGASLNGGPAGGAAGTDLFMMTGSTVMLAPGATGNVPNVITFNGTIADDSIASIGTPSYQLISNYPIGSGAGLTIYAGLTVFNGENTYSGQTIINGGALGGPLNTGTNTSGPPNYALTDGALQAADGVGLPATSNLNFAGPGQYTGGVLQTNGTFDRWVSTNPASPNGVQWTGSGGFAAINGPLTVTLGADSVAGGQLVWGATGFVPFGSSLIFGSANSTDMVTFTNPIDVSGGNASILVANNGNPSGSMATMSGVISGSGGLSIGGGGFTGALILTGANTYSGGTTVTGAMLAINSGAAIGTGQLTLNNSILLGLGALTIPQAVTFQGSDTIDLNSNNVTLSGAVNGPGVLTAINGGTLNLTGTVGTVAGLGGIVLGSGTILYASSTANAGLVSSGTNNNIVVVTTSGSQDVFTGSVHVVGPLDVVNGTTPELVILPGDTLVGVGSVNIMTVVENAGGNSPGDGPGTIIATAPVVDLPGSTYTVAIDGPISSVSCASPSGCAGTYSSTIVTGSSNTYTAAGTLAPILRGISGPANNNYTPPVGMGFLVVEAAGGVLGSFSSLTQPAAGLAPGTRFDALYFNSASSTSATAINYAENSAGNPNAIALWVTPASYQNLSAFNVSLTENQSQVGFALDALRGINDSDPALSDPAGLKNNPQATWDFGNLFPQQPQALPAIFDTLTGEVNADAELGSFQLMNQFLQLMVDPAARGHTGGFGGATGFAPEEREELPPEVAAAYDAMMPLPAKAASFDQRWSAWGSAYGGVNNTSGDPLVGTHDVSTAVYGVAGGMDYRATPDTLFGFALGGGSTNWAVTQNLGTGRSYDFQVGLYSKTRIGPAYVAGAVAFAEQFMQTNREAFGADHLGAQFNAETYGARLEAGYRYALPYVGVTPYAAAQALAFHSPNYSETDFSGGGFGLSYASTTQTDLSGEIGAFFDSFLLVDDMPLILRAHAAWQHDWVSNPALAATFEAATLPGALPGAATSFVVNGAALPQNLALASAGAELHFTPSITVGAWLDSQLAGRYQTLAGTGTVRYTW